MTSEGRAVAFKMAANKLRLASIKLLELSSYKSVYNPVHRLYCTIQSKENESSSAKESQFVKFYKKEVSIKENLDSCESKPEDNVTFASLLRNSKFIDLGNPKGKIVLGEIFHVVSDDLYIDFGWKFHTVCKKPPKNQNLYIPGTKVKLMIKDLELSTRFLGSTDEITLLEADCVLLGLADSKAATQ